VSKFIAIVILLSLNGFFVAAEFSLVRSRRTKLEAMIRAGDTKARLALRAIGNLGRMLSAGQLGITLASLGLGWVAESTLGEIMRHWFAGLPLALELPVRIGIGATVALVIITYCHVVFGELAPRAFALGHPEHVARWLAPPLMLFAWIMTPFIFVLNKSAHGVLRVFGQKVSPDEEAVHSPEELRMLIEHSQERGALERQDAAMIEGVFEFSEKTAREVMTPRTEIVALSTEETLEETLTIVQDGGFSRYPVYEETIDNIVGLVLSKDLIPVLRKPPAKFSVRSIMRDVHVVPGSREVEEVLADFKRLKEHMAIVLDEYGGTAGVVTMEDLLEEIVGEILDEYDDAVIVVPSSGGGEVVIPGTTHINELCERFGLDVPDDDYTTIGGFVFGSLGRLPVPGDRVTAGGAVFTVKQMEGRRIETLLVDLHSVGDRRGKEREEKSSA
jgi:CBS domain containing-hemolysin-like protein